MPQWRKSDERLRQEVRLRQILVLALRRQVEEQMSHDTPGVPFTARQWLEHATSQLNSLYTLFKEDGWKADCTLLQGLSTATSQINEAIQSLPSEITPTAHTDHPLRHFDRTCPACLEEHPAVAAPSAGTPGSGTHWLGCGMEGGPRHYECLLREHEQLKRELAEAKKLGSDYSDDLKNEIFALKERLAQSASGPTREQVESLIKRIDDAMAFGMTGRDALPNLLRDCLAALAAVGGKSDG